MLPREMASAVNLFVHPLAGRPRHLGVGIGLASHGFGLWLGAVSAHGRGVAAHVLAAR